MTTRTRFAPSPTGPLHLGHAYSALHAFNLAAADNGLFFLRIEDIDRSRSRPEWEQQIYDDLKWLGLVWPQPVMRQSERMAAYRDAMIALNDLGLLYECHCNRRDILSAVSAPQEGAEPVTGPDGLVYPGTCRPKVARPIALTSGQALRLNMSAITQFRDVSFVEQGSGPKGETGSITFSLDRALGEIGDVVLARRDMGTSYHLSVVVDDHAQGITHVTRGRDLFGATAIHVMLQRLLGFEVPLYHHHRLIRDEKGKRLAKRDDARAISRYREDGLTPDEVKRLVGL